MIEAVTTSVRPNKTRPIIIYHNVSFDIISQMYNCMAYMNCSSVRFELIPQIYKYPRKEPHIESGDWDNHTQYPAVSDLHLITIASENRIIIQATSLLELLCVLLPQCHIISIYDDGVRVLHGWTDRKLLQIWAQSRPSMCQDMDHKLAQIVRSIMGSVTGCTTIWCTK